MGNVIYNKIVIGTIVCDRCNKPLNGEEHYTLFDTIRWAKVRVCSKCKMIEKLKDMV